jgi:hypothetical protein
MDCACEKCGGECVDCKCKACGAPVQPGAEACGCGGTEMECKCQGCSEG